MQPTITGEIQSPMGIASVEFVDPREPVAVSFSIFSIFVVQKSSYCFLIDSFFSSLVYQFWFLYGNWLTK